jgi:hypothetical protein
LIDVKPRSDIPQDVGPYLIPIRMAKFVLHRRDLLRFTIAGVGAAAESAVAPETVAAKSVDLNDKRKARYQADSGEVRNFYRVNSYPAR